MRVAVCPAGGGGSIADEKEIHTANSPGAHWFTRIGMFRGVCPPGDTACIAPAAWAWLEAEVGLKSIKLCGEAEKRPVSAAPAAAPAKVSPVTSPSSCHAGLPHARPSRRPLARPRESNREDVHPHAPSPLADPVPCPTALPPHPTDPIWLELRRRCARAENPSLTAANLLGACSGGGKVNARAGRVKRARRRPSLDFFFFTSRTQIGDETPGGPRAADAQSRVVRFEGAAKKRLKRWSGRASPDWAACFASGIVRPPPINKPLPLLPSLLLLLLPIRPPARPKACCAEARLRCPSCLHPRLHQSGHRPGSTSPQTTPAFPQ